MEIIAPYKGFDWHVVPPAIEMLIALYSTSGGIGLFQWENTVVRQITGLSASIGSGVVQMHPMLSDLQDVKYNPYPVRGSVRAMLFHGVRIMHRTKRLVRDCGKRTEAMAMMGDGARRRFGIRELGQLEKLVEDFEQYTTTTMLAQLVCRDISDQEFEKYVADVPSAIKDFRRQFDDIIQPSIFQTSTGQP
jgi:hypothetical protein